MNGEKIREVGNANINQCIAYSYYYSVNYSFSCILTKEQILQEMWKRETRIVMGICLENQIFGALYLCLSHHNIHSSVLLLVTLSYNNVKINILLCWWLLCFQLAGRKMVATCLVGNLFWFFCHMSLVSCASCLRSRLAQSVTFTKIIGLNYFLS